MFVQFVAVQQGKLLWERHQQVQDDSTLWRTEEKKGVIFMQWGNVFEVLK